MPAGLIRMLAKKAHPSRNKNFRSSLLAFDNLETLSLHISIGMDNVIDFGKYPIHISHPDVYADNSKYRTQLSCIIECALAL
jgi:hypothetical protein